MKLLHRRKPKAPNAYTDCNRSMADFLFDITPPVGKLGRVITH